jgi:hypothetical protein
MLTFVFSISFIARHTDGFMFWAYLLAAASGLHLLLGLTFSGLPDFQAYTLSILFSVPVMIVSLALLLTSLTCTSAIGIAAMKEEEAKESGTFSDENISIGFVSFSLTTAVFFGVASLVSSQACRISLRDRLCSYAEGSVSDTWKDRRTQALSLAEWLTQRDLADKLPCPERDE